MWIFQPKFSKQIFWPKKVDTYVTYGMLTLNLKSGYFPNKI